MATRSFGMHPKLLVDVIKRQAGSIQKAILEGVMNAIEAGATRVDVTLDPRKFTIKDNGKGFRSMKEVEDFFETFGQPHKKSEGKIWAQFRMGRGQMFAFGRNMWRTGNFEMLVDINAIDENSTGINYELNEVAKATHGCDITVDLYSPLSTRDLNECRRELETYVAWVKCPVHVNGVQISKDPEKAKWDADSNKDAYIKLSSGDWTPLKIYNLGVLVCRLCQSEVGVGGTIVSKHRLDVNFARNDIIRSCKVWQRIKALIERSAGLKKVKQKRSFSPAERINVINRFLDGDKDVDPFKQKLVVDTQGRAHSLNDIKKKFHCFTIGHRHDMVCDKAMQRGLAFCVDEENAELFSPRDPKKMFKVIFKQSNRCGFDLPYKTLSDVSKGIDSKHYQVPEDKWTLTERLWLRFIERVSLNAFRMINWKNNRWTPIKTRRLLVGESDTADGWTDGVSCICINRRALPDFKRNRDYINFGNVARVIDIVCHEYCHVGTGSDRNHGHDNAFYKKFHDEVGVWQEMAMSEAMSISPKKLDDMTKAAKKKTKVDDEPAQTPTSATCPLCGNGKKEPVAEPVAAKVVAPKKAVKKTPKPKKVAKPVGHTSVVALRNAGMSFRAIEKKLGLRENNGMTAYRAYKAATK